MYRNILKIFGHNEDTPRFASLRPRENPDILILHLCKGPEEIDFLLGPDQNWDEPIYAIDGSVQSNFKVTRCDKHTLEPNQEPFVGKVVIDSEIKIQFTRGQSSIEACPSRSTVAPDTVNPSSAVSCSIKVICANGRHSFFGECFEGYGESKRLVTSIIGREDGSCQFEMDAGFLQTQDQLDKHVTIALSIAQYAKKYIEDKAANFAPGTVPPGLESDCAS